MENQEEKLTLALRDVCDKNWNERQTPLLLSSLPRLIEERVKNYREVLGGRTLKAFIKEIGDSSGFMVVEHPTQKARVGITPTNANYSFPSESSSLPKTAVVKSNREVTLAFFSALATVSDAELDKVVIPASVLVKLLK